MSQDWPAERPDYGRTFTGRYEPLLVDMLGQLIISPLSTVTVVDNHPIMLQSDTTFPHPIGTLITLQDGVQGSPIGLLLALTRTALFFNGVLTSLGPRKLKNG